VIIETCVKYPGGLTRIAVADVTAIPQPNGKKRPFGCNGYVTAMAVGQRQRLYSGFSARTFTGNYLSSTPRELRTRGAQLEFCSLVYIMVFQGGDDGRGYRNMCKMPGGSVLDLAHWPHQWR
jgi:hypothetical protein